MFHDDEEKEEDDVYDVNDDDEDDDVNPRILIRAQLLVMIGMMNSKTISTGFPHDLFFLLQVE